MYAGPGFGGSCFPKDVKALVKIAKDHGYTAEMLSQTLATNEKQKHVLADMVLEHFDGNLKDKVFSVWGLAFKAGTDDMRESSALTIVKKLIDKGAKIRAHDPEAMQTAKWPEYFGDNPAISYFEDKYEALEGTDGMLIITEWKEFRTPDFSEMKKRLKQALIFDGRLLYEPKKMQELGFVYKSIGR
jgi:UDPglucose 6-dehydrogenase